MSYRFLTDVKGNKIALTANSAAITPLNITGAVSQTGDLQQWQNNDGSVLAYITSGCNLFAPNATFGTSTFLSSVHLGVTASSASSIPLAVKAATSQSANLQEWQNSSGTAVSYVLSSGNFTIPTLNTTTLQNSANSNNSRLQLPSSGALVDTAVAANVALRVQNANATPTGDLTQWLNTGGTVLSAVTSAGNLVVRGTSAQGALTVYSPSTSSVGAVIRGIASQTADLQQWQNSSGAVLTWITSAGSIRSTAQAVFGSTNYGAQVNTGASSASTVGHIIRGAASQTANLQEWQDSTGTVVAAVLAGGNLRVPTLQTQDGFTFITNASGTRNVGLCTNTMSAGGGSGVVWIANATTIPTSTASAGAIIYANSGALSFTGTSLPNGGTTGTNVSIVNADGTQGNAPIAITSTTGTAYTIGLTDAGKNLEINTTSINTVSIPTDATTNFPIGTQITIVQVNTGATTISAATPATTTVNFYSPTSAANATLKGRWAAATIIKRAANTWIVIGNLT